MLSMLEVCGKFVGKFGIGYLGAQMLKANFKANFTANFRLTSQLAQTVKTLPTGHIGLFFTKLPKLPKLPQLPRIHTLL